VPIAISNLALPEVAGAAGFEPLIDFGLDGVEVAPTRIAPWGHLTPERTKEYRHILDDMGLKVPALQAILFGVEGVALLKSTGEFSAMRDHLDRVGEIGALLGASVAVFGSPLQRDCSHLDAATALSLGAERLEQLAAVVGQYDMVLGIEPVPTFYRGTFLQTWQEVYALVEQVEHPALACHLDIGCVTLGGGSIQEAISCLGSDIAHFHVSERSLGSFEHPEFEHARAAAALETVGYRGWCSVEMIGQGSRQLEDAAVAIAFSRSLYGGVSSPCVPEA